MRHATIKNPGKFGDRLRMTPEGYAGYGVYDPRGCKIGNVKAIFVNERGEPEYVRTKMGFLGTRYVLIPVCSVSVDEERRAITLL